MLLGVYQRMGAFRRSGERHGAEELRGRLGILDRFRRLHEALLNILADAGYLTRDGDRVGTTPAVDASTRTSTRAAGEAAEFDRIAAALPDIRADGHPQPACSSRGRTRASCAARWAPPRACSPAPG